MTSPTGAQSALAAVCCSCMASLLEWLPNLPSYGSRGHQQDCLQSPEHKCFAIQRCRYLHTLLVCIPDDPAPVTSKPVYQSHVHTAILPTTRQPNTPPSTPAAGAQLPRNWQASSYKRWLRHCWQQLAGGSLCCSTLLITAPRLLAVIDSTSSFIVHSATAITAPQCTLALSHMPTLSYGQYGITCDNHGTGTSTQPGRAAPHRQVRQQA